MDRCGSQRTHPALRELLVQNPAASGLVGRLTHVVCCATSLGEGSGEGKKRRPAAVRLAVVPAGSGRPMQSIVVPPPRAWCGGRGGFVPSGQQADVRATALTQCPQATQGAVCHSAGLCSKPWLPDPHACCSARSGPTIPPGGPQDHQGGFPPGSWEDCCSMAMHCARSL